jgi:ADP-heptose:LPS heptosyltransferase
MEAHLKNPTCWFLRTTQPVGFVSLGRSGDLMILFPGFKAIYDYTGIKPIVFTSRDFASIFNGISYAQCRALNVNWRWGAREAVKIAKREFDNVVVPKWWDDPTFKAPPIIEPHVPTVTVTYDNRRYTFAKEDYKNYMMSQWKHAGFTQEQFHQWPLVFDRRNKANEAALKKFYYRTGKPKLLFNFGGHTSPCRNSQPISRILASFQSHFELIDLGRVRAPFVFDLLGLYDDAVGLITSDTATLHLAGASPIEYIGLIANGTGGSLTRGNCLLRVRYNKIPVQLAEIEAVVRKWKEKK